MTGFFIVLLAFAAIMFLVMISSLNKPLIISDEEAKKQLQRKPQRVYVTAIGGEECPKCKCGGLFKEGNIYRCEECLTTFDENKKPVK